jgi:hypothetical protein
VFVSEDDQETIELLSYSDNISGVICFVWKRAKAEVPETLD